MRHRLFRLLALSWIGFGLITPLQADTQAYIPDLGGGRVLRVAADESFRTVALAGEPYGAAVTPDGRRVLVSRTAAGSVAVITAETFESAGSQVHVAVGSGPRGVAVTPDGRYAFVANFEDDSVSQIALSSMTVTATHAVGSGPWGVAAFYDDAAATHRVYVANHLDNSVSVITTEAITRIENVGNGPLGLALTPDGQWLYVANYNDDTVAVIRTSDHSLFDVVRVGDGPFGVAVGMQGESVFVSNSFSDSVSVIRVSDNLIERTYAVGFQPMGVAAPVNGDYAYVVNSRSNSVTRIGHADGTLDTILTGELNAAVALGAFFGGPPPEAPGALAAVPDSSGRIQLSWTDRSSDELGFAIERRREPDAEFEEIARVGADRVDFSDGGLQSEATYVYRVRAFNETGFSAYSATAQATTEDSDTAVSWCFIGTLLH